MNLLSAVKTFSQVRWRQLASSSLQFRLTAGITVTSVLGLGGLAVWTGWTMQQLLVTTHIRNARYVADRFPRDVMLYSEMLPIDAAVQRAIGRADASANESLSASNLFIWVKRPDGTVLAQSQTLIRTTREFAHDLIDRSEMPPQPQIYRIKTRYLLLYSGPLTVEGTTLGQLYIAEDITQEQSMLVAVIQQIRIATILAILLLTLVIALYIRRSLYPLRRMSQLAGTISAEGLSEARLYLDRAPSEVQELAQMLDKMLSRLSQSWEQQRQFVSNVSHELRTPLTVVYGYLQSLLRRSATLSVPQREALEISAAETERTIRLLQDLLELARADSGYIPLHLEFVDLNSWVEEVVGMGEKFSNRQIEIQSDRPIVRGKVDRDRLTQVLINLIDNAVKYSDPEDPIVVKLAQTDEHTTIQVCDRGRGIPLQQQTRIFERFYRVDEARARSTGGVGLGLAIVKSLVEAMGGHVTVWSKLDEGSTFTVTLPTHPPM